MIKNNSATAVRIQSSNSSHIVFVAQNPSRRGAANFISDDRSGLYRIDATHGRFIAMQSPYQSEREFIYLYKLDIYYSEDMFCHEYDIYFVQS